MTVFSRFEQQEMEYLVLDRGITAGNVITQEKPIKGIFKYRDGMTANNGVETRTSAATVHVHPEDFEDVAEIKGNGIKYENVVYQISGVTEGRNFRTGEVEHYTLTLEAQAPIPEDADYIVAEEDESE